MSEYTLVLVAFTPNASGPPTLTELGPITAPAFSQTDNLEAPCELRFSCLADRLPSDVRTRLDADLPSEVRLYRDSTLRFAGPLLGHQISGGSLSGVAADCSWYASRWFIDSDLDFTTDDQFVIVQALWDQWQTLSYGDFGIDTTSVGTSGVTRSIAYSARENHVVLTRSRELGAADDGFDLHVTPQRELVLSHPQRGSDLSDGVVLDGRNISEGSTSTSWADVASEAYGTATANGTSPLTSLQSDAGVRAVYGRRAVSGTFDGVTVQGELDGHTQGLLAKHATRWFQPGAGLHPVADVDVDSFDVGDTVAYTFDAGLGLHVGNYRVVSKQVSVDSSGQEAISVEFE